jgi:hypothetical protein
VHHFGEWLQATPLSVTIQSVTWVIPLVQSIHILMIGVVFVSSLMISLRVLGRARTDQAFADVRGRFAPWMWGGFIVMAGTGATLIIGEPIREFTALSFWIKMALLVIAVATSAALARGPRPRARAGGAATAAAAEFSAGSKALAIASVALWLAIIFFGRAIAYDVEVWGSLSLHG